jgi:hypothetical protein
MSIRTISFHVAICGTFEVTYLFVAMNTKIISFLFERKMLDQRAPTSK